MAEIYLLEGRYLDGGWASTYWPICLADSEQRARAIMGEVKRSGRDQAEYRVRRVDDDERTIAEHSIRRALDSKSETALFLAAVIAARWKHSLSIRAKERPSEPDSFGDSAIGRLRHKLFLASLRGSRYETEAADKIVVWAKKQHGVGDYAPDSAEPLARHLLRTRNMTLEDIAQTSVEDLAVLIGVDGDEPKEPKYPENWSAEEIEKWKANLPRLKYKAQGISLQIKHNVAGYEQEWNRRIGTPFPGVSLEALMGLASWAGLDIEQLESMNAWDIYQAAMSAIEEKGGVRSDQQPKAEPSPEPKAPSPDTLTQRENNILEALGEKTMTGPELAQAAGYSYNSSHRNTLSNLVKRGHLIKNADGYCCPK